MSKNEKYIDDVLREYIEQDEDFEHLDDDDKIYMYSTLKKILKLMNVVLKYPNVCPILFVHTPKTKQILEDAFFSCGSHYSNNPKYKNNCDALI